MTISISQALGAKSFYKKKFVQLFLTLYFPSISDHRSLWLQKANENPTPVSSLYMQSSVPNSYANYAMDSETEFPPTMEIGQGIYPQACGGLPQAWDMPVRARVQTYLFRHHDLARPLPA